MRRDPSVRRFVPVFALGFLVLCAFLARHGGAAPSNRIDRGAARLHFAKGDRAVVPLDVRNHAWVRGAIGGSDSVSILIDTGAAGDCIRDVRAAELKLELGQPRQARGAGGTVASRVTEPVTLGLPGFEIRGDRLATLPLEEIGQQAGRDLDVVVGRPLFAQAVVVLDYERATMEVIDPEKWKYEGKGIELPLTFENGHPYVEAKLTLPGREPVTGRFVLDTGSAAPLILNADFTAEHGVLEAVGHTVQGAARGVGGQIVNPVGRVERLELGGFALEKPVTTFRSAGPGYISADGSIGNIGSGILRRFRVIFDYSRARLILEPGETIADPFEYDMSGLSLQSTGGDHRRFVVARVIENSPASELGIQPGDQVVAVDGRPVAEIGIYPLREMLRKEGAEHRITLERDASRREVVLRTRRLI